MGQAHVELRPGSVVGGHRILETLGRGTMAFVYRAQSPTGEEVALKVLFSDDARTPALVERFRREASAAARIAHPHLARCLGSGEEGGMLYLVLELVRGRSLAERLRLSGKLEPREAARIGAEVAQALAAVHAAGFVHRDVKPENILLDATGGVKLTDLGVARRTATGGSLTHTGELVGTPEYMAPEQAEGARRVDSRADLYSLGMLVYALVAGAPAFVGTAYSVVTKQLTQTPRRLRAIVPETPPELDALVAALLAKDPEARPGEASQVARQLQVIARGPVPRAAGTGGSRGLMVALALLGVVVLGLAVGAGILFAGGTGVPGPQASPAASPTTGATTAPAPGLAAPTPPPGARDRPPWYDSLPEHKRPAWPLPDAIAFSRTPGEYVATKDATVVLLFVPGGAFSLGSASLEGNGSREQGRRGEGEGAGSVTLTPFFVGKYEVTNAQFRRWASGKNLTAPGARDRDRAPAKPLSWEHPFPEADAPPVQDDEPVVVVTAEQAIAYAHALGLDLPTEAQWERAAAADAGSSRARFPWGDGVPGKGTGGLANLADGSFAKLYPDAGAIPDYEDGFARLAPVGVFPVDRSAVGCCDVMGNVRELCLDYWSNDFFERSRGAVDPVQLMPGVRKARVVRGGAWDCRDPALGIWSRDKAEVASNTVGFRLALGTAGR